MTAKPCKPWCGTTDGGLSYFTRKGLFYCRDRCVRAAIKAERSQTTMSDETRPTARELAHDAMAEADRRDTLKVRSLYGHWNLEAPCGPLCDALTAAIEADRAALTSALTRRLEEAEGLLRDSKDPGGRYATCLAYPGACSFADNRRCWSHRRDDFLAPSPGRTDKAEETR